MAKQGHTFVKYIVQSRNPVTKARIELQILHTEYPKYKAKQTALLSASYIVRSFGIKYGTLYTKVGYGIA